MKPRRSNPFIVWFCLIWFGLTNTVLAGGLVVCNDGHGDSRIEWGCGKSVSGECLTSCSEEPGDEPAHPCQDTPINGDAQVTPAPPRSIDIGSVVLPEILAACVFWTADFQPKSFLCKTPEPEGPPDTLRRIRTIVLLV